MYNRYHHMTEPQLRQMAEFWKDVIEVDGQEVRLDPSDLEWRFEESYPLANFGEAESWINWFQGETKAWAAAGEPNRYTDMFGAPIRQPAIAVEYQGRSFPWDGSHRVGASFADGKTTIPTIVGKAKEK